MSTAFRSARPTCGDMGGHIVDSADAVMDRSCCRDGIAGIAGLRVDADCSCGSK